MLISPCIVVSQQVPQYQVIFFIKSWKRENEEEKTWKDCLPKKKENACKTLVSIEREGNKFDAPRIGYMIERREDQSTDIVLKYVLRCAGVKHVALVDT